MGYGKPNKLEQAVEAALKSVRGLSSEDLLGLVTFDAEAEVILDLQPANLERIQSELKGLTVRGVSCIAAGVTEAVNLLEKKHLKGTVMPLTDGRANLSLNRSGGFEGSLGLETELLNISKETRRKNLRIHAVSIGEDAFTYTLSMMAEYARGLHWIAETFQGLDSKPRELQLKVNAEGLRVHSAPVELPSAQPTWTKESQYTHLAVVSQNLYETYESGCIAFLTNPSNNRSARTGLISIEEGSLTGYRERKTKTVEEVRNGSAILLDRSYRDYLSLGGEDSVNLFLFQLNLISEKE